MNLHCFILLSGCGGNVSWDKSMCPGASYDVSDQTITHQIVDRPKLNEMVVNRYVFQSVRQKEIDGFLLNRVYVQPQWIFDSINARKLLPIDNYLPGNYKSLILDR